ncbi:hypothetical protein [Flavobacterium sp. 5]|uniref:hypothetical protein n=1 Tax=Flavobacterium sp. 5 TaxID=2035199 RepID=UPI000C2C8220|nr:hypothetical protein [Flavobacterium sp. 5]PKB18906.1 hypothetical protein CLU82_4207 [Flavobacterium sp. 5]
MKNEKKLGIWMDHSIAYIIEFSDQWNELKIIESNFKHLDKVISLAKIKSLLNNKEQQIQAEFYKKLEIIIFNYDTVLLFGPTNAKKELLNKMKINHRFSDIKLEVKEADKMNKIEKIHFLLKHFDAVKV